MFFLFGDFWSCFFVEIFYSFFLLGVFPFVPPFHGYFLFDVFYGCIIDFFCQGFFPYIFHWDFGWGLFAGELWLSFFVVGCRLGFFYCCLLLGFLFFILFIYLLGLLFIYLFSFKHLKCEIRSWILALQYLSPNI